MKSILSIGAALLIVAISFGCGSDDNNGGTNNGSTNNGATNNGATNNGATNNGTTNNGATNNGVGGCMGAADCGGNTPVCCQNAFTAQCVENDGQCDQLGGTILP